MGIFEDSILISDDKNLVKSFKTTALEVADLLQQEQIFVRATSSGECLHFKALSSETKSQVLEKLERVLKIYKMVLQQGGNLRQSRMLFWIGMKEMGLKFASDLLDCMSEDPGDPDLIEVYDASHVQMFCNTRFYELTSYTLEDIFCRPWHDLFEREVTSNTGEIVRVATELFSGKVSETISMDYLGAQKMKEAMSPFHYEYKMKIKYFSPLKCIHTNTTTAVVAIEKATITNKEAIENIEEKLLLDHCGHPAN